MPQVDVSAVLNSRQQDVRRAMQQALDDCDGGKSLDADELSKIFLRKLRTSLSQWVRVQDYHVREEPKEKK